MSQRWLERMREADGEEKKKNIRNHFFARDARGLIRDNGLSRLWWLGYIASKVDLKNPHEFLEIIYHKQDIRSALIERPSVSMNLTVLKAVYRVMKKHWGNATDKDKVSLFERDIFRDWMRRINRRGGVLLLDALGSTNLSRLVTEEAGKALDGTERRQVNEQRAS